MIEMILKKLEMMFIDPVWFVLAFLGVIFAIGSRQIESITRWKIVNTFSSGMIIGISAPVILRDGFGFDSTALLAVAAMLGSFFGMKITASVLQLDLQDVIAKRFGGKKK